MIRNEFAYNSLCLGVFLFAFGAAHAQTTPDRAKAPIGVSGDDVLQEVIVTAERQPEVAQRTPISVTVYSAADIAREGVVDMQSLAAADPSLQFYSSLGVSSSTAPGAAGVGAKAMESMKRPTSGEARSPLAGTVASSATSRPLVK